MLSKESVLNNAGLTYMTTATSVFAVDQGGLYRDIDRDLHCEVSASSKFSMNYENIKDSCYWIVPETAVVMAPELNPVREVLDLTEEKFGTFNQGQGGKEPSPFVKLGDSYDPITWGYTARPP